MRLASSARRRRAAACAGPSAASAGCTDTPARASSATSRPPTCTGARRARAQHLGVQHRGLRAVHVAQQHGELVAAEAGHQVVRAGQRGQPAGHLQTSSSPRACPRVSLTSRNRSRSSSTSATERAGLTTAAAQLGVEQRAVGQPGQAVVQGLVLVAVAPPAAAGGTRSRRCGTGRATARPGRRTAARSPGSCRRGCWPAPARRAGRARRHQPAPGRRRTGSARRPRAAFRTARAARRCPARSLLLMISASISPSSASSSSCDGAVLGLPGVAVCGSAVYRSSPSLCQILIRAISVPSREPCTARSRAATLAAGSSRPRSFADSSGWIAIVVVSTAASLADSRPRAAIIDASSWASAAPRRTTSVRLTTANRTSRLARRARRRVSTPDTRHRGLDPDHPFGRSHAQTRRRSAAR